MKWLLLVLFIAPLSLSGQVLTQTFVDPCSGQVVVVTVPIANGKTTIVYRGKYRTVTSNDITSGELQAWINNLTISFPCPQATVAVTQTVTQAVQQAVAQATSTATAQATSSATSAAASAATSAAVSTPPPVSTTPPATSSTPKTETKTESSSETKSETKTESKSEEKSESKSESKSEEKKSENKSEKKSESKKSSAPANPIIYSSDFTVAPNQDVVSIIASVGMSQASLMGNTSWGISSMIWSTFDQFALSGRYTMMNFNEGKLQSISNFGITGVYLGGNVLGFATGAYIYPLGKYGVSGANYTFSVAGADKGLNLSNNILLFYTIPVKINKRLTISPDVYLSGSSTGYLTDQKVFVTSDDVGIMTGASFDIAFTKRFKLNFALKTSFSTNVSIPQSYMGMIGTKMQL
jgi:outer membrane biosynthesis protein TonB